MKNPVLTIVVGVVIIIAIIGFFTAWNKVQNSQSQNLQPVDLTIKEESKNINQPIVEPTIEEQEVNFGSIADAILKRLSLKCMFTDDQGRNVTAYIKGGAIRSDARANNPQQAGSFIMKNQQIYYWNIHTKKGYIMGTVAQNLNGSPVPTTAQQKEATTFMSVLEKFKDSCRPTFVSDSVFITPTNVQFQQTR